MTAVTIGIALFASYWLGSEAGLESATGVNVGGIFGTAVATMGMLMTTAYILAMDTFGPITDNAGGIAEFSRAEAGAREITDRLDAVGNTTKALTKGYAIASASLAAFLLFSAYIDKINVIQGRRIEAGVPGAELLNSVNLQNVNVFIAALLAAMLAYFFSSLAIRAVGTTAQSIIVEVRRQFREMPGIMDYSQRPDYARVVDITTKAALREMVLPGLVAVFFPIVIGLLLGAEAVAGMLMVGTIAGVLLATVLNNGGGAWDNAKKYIESGNLKDDQGNVLGKGSDAHAAAVVGDTVGDPFKDTAGPSLHVLVKLLATISLSSPRSSSGRHRLIVAPDGRECRAFTADATPRSRRHLSERIAPGACAMRRFACRQRHGTRRQAAGPDSMDTVFQALVMGIVQGLTEFLPVSSSGHLVIVPYLFGWDDAVHQLAGVQRDAPHGHADRAARSTSGPTGSGSSQPGLRHDPRPLVPRATRTASSPGCSSRRPSRPPSPGFLFNDLIETSFRQVGLVARDARRRRRDPVARRSRSARRRAHRRRRRSRSRSASGVAQALALIPGISRSGISISAGRFAGLNRRGGGPLRFLMATPVTAGCRRLRGPQAADRRGRRRGRAPAPARRAGRRLWSPA